MSNTITKRPLPEVPADLPKLPDDLVYVGKGDFLFMKEAECGVRPFAGPHGHVWKKDAEGFYTNMFHRALPKDSPLLEKYFITPTMKASIKLTTLTGEEIRLPSGHVAFRITEQENIGRHWSTPFFSASNGLTVGSVLYPNFSGAHFALRGDDKKEDNKIIVVTHEEFAKIQKAVAEYLEHLNAPKYLYTATFMYKSDKNGTQKRRLVDVKVENNDYIEGDDRDVKDGNKYRRFKKSNIVDGIKKVPKD